MRIRSAAVLLLGLAGGAGASGSDLYMANCAICHQPDGAGLAGVYPPLKESIGSYVRAPEGRAYLVHVLTYGVAGTISVGGVSYSGFMQPWPQFHDAELAQVLNHVLEKFNAKLLPAHFEPFTAAEVEKLRGPSRSFADVHGERETVLKALGGTTTGEREAPGS